MNSVAIAARLCERLGVETRAPAPLPEKNATRSVDFFLPGSDGDFCAFPNSIALSSLFSIFAARDKEGKKIKTFQGEQLTNRAGAVVKYWGGELDEQQATIWTRLIFEASAGGGIFTILPKKFLRDVGMGTGGKDFSFLRSAIE